MKSIGLIVGLWLAALVGCDGTSVVDGVGGSPVRGELDAGSAGGSAGSVGGAPGAGGGTVTGGGGASGAAGAAAAGGRSGSIGGSTGAGGSFGGTYMDCSAYGWTPNGGITCSQQTSPGVYVVGKKDGRTCNVCNNPARPTGVPDCRSANGPDLCVVSCSECTFQ